MINQFLSYCRYREFSNNTIISYGTDLKQFSAVVSDLANVSNSDIMTWLSTFDSSATKCRKLSTLKSFYDWATTAAKIMSVNPVIGIKSPKIPKREMDYVKKQEYIDVEDSLDERNYRYNNRDKMMFDIMFNCGLRIFEVVAMNVSDLDLNNKTFNVIGKGNKERVCYLNSVVMESIKIWLRDREQILKTENRNSSALFITKCSDRISVRGAQKIVEKFANTHAHAFRHGFCSELSNKNINVKTIAKLAGHSSITTTSRYMHVNKEAMENAVAMLEG